MKRIGTWLIAVTLLLGLTTLALAQRDRLIADEDEATAGNIWGFIENQDYEFSWRYIPGKIGFYEGQEPHGAILRTYVNNIAFDAIEAQNQTGEFPHGTIIIKENHVTEHMTGENGDEGEEQLADFIGNLESITLMVKVRGYNPDVGDWFWAKYQPDGSIDAAGQADGCIGCHSQVADQDYVFTVNVADEGQ